MSKTLLNLLLIITSVACYYIIISPIYFGGGYVYDVPADQSIIKLREFKNSNEEDSNKLKEAIVKINDLKKEYEGIDQYTQDRLNIMIPDSINNVRLMSEITTLMSSFGLPASGISITKEVEDKKLPGIGIYSISFSTKGSYFDLKDLLSKLETSMRLFSVQSVSFSPSEKPDEPMTVSIKMNTYYIK